jgi:hypothetical protein
MSEQVVVSSGPCQQKETTRRNPKNSTPTALHHCNRLTLPFGNTVQAQKSHLQPQSATATIQPEYTNTITTIRHPPLGSLRPIHLAGEPWLCLADISRMLETPASSKAGELLNSPEVEHGSGQRFLPLDLPLAWRSEPRDAFGDWMLSILLIWRFESGRGRFPASRPTPFFQERK